MVKNLGLIPTEDEPEVARLAEAMFRVRLEVWLTRRLAASAASEVLLAAWRPTVASAVAYNCRPCPFIPDFILILSKFNLDYLETHFIQILS